MYHFLIKYLETVTPKDSKASFEEPLGIVTYLFKHLLPFTTKLKIIFEILSNSRWYPAELPRAELKLLKVLGEKFEDLFF